MIIVTIVLRRPSNNCSVLTLLVLHLYVRRGRMLANACLKYELNTYLTFVGNVRRLRTTE